MTDKKPNNNDIIKALDICSKSTNGCSHSKYTCEDCYLNGQPMCSSVLLQDAIDLHTRQQAEYENLKVENQSLRSAANSLKIHYEEAQAEIERLKKTEIEIDDFCRRLCRMRMLNGSAIASYEDLQNYIQEEKSKSVKEFAERVKEFMHNKFKALDEYEFEYITERDIDNLLKETEGENNA